MVAWTELRRTLADLDHAFSHAAPPSQVFNAVRAAVRECRQTAPDLLAELRRTVSVRGEVACLDNQRTIAALGGAPQRDAIFFRDLARTLEHNRDSEDLLRACVCWDGFRQEAVREGWFAERSLDVAALYLHMAGLLGQGTGAVGARNATASWQIGFARKQLLLFSGRTLRARLPDRPASGRLFAVAAVGSRKFER